MTSPPSPTGVASDEIVRLTGALKAADRLRFALGRALLGRHVGEVVEVNAPGGRYRCWIESAERR